MAYLSHMLSFPPREILDTLSETSTKAAMSLIVAVLTFWLITLVLQRPSFAFRSLSQHRTSSSLKEENSSSSSSGSGIFGADSPVTKRIQQTFAEDAFKETLQWWDDLAPTFVYEPNLQATLVHFCFLVHGHRGYSRDLAYLQAKMNQMANETLCSDGGSVSSKDLVVHAAVCNERKTTDGVKSGGERLVEEMVQVIRENMQGRNTTSITVSVLGNSLGGIYGRYAIARLAEICQRDPDDSKVWILDGMYRIHLNVFCTTATPHLGVASHTFLPIPRTAEIGVAHAMGDTGRDLFRLNDLLLTMATSSAFLRPLGCFRKRIAYANAFGTDFPVPVHTAAFLSSASAYPHHFEEEDTNDEDGSVLVDDNGLVVAKVHTPPLSDDSTQLHYEGEVDDLAMMSASLDSLGWKKVFIDVRKDMPKIPLPQLRLRRSLGNDSGSSSDTESGEVSESVNPTIENLKERRIVGSKDVAAAVTKPMFESDQFHWPVGHNMIVAFSRSRLSSYLNRAGRPFVDGLAKDLVKDILLFSQQDPNRRFSEPQLLQTVAQDEQAS
jgi:Putative serine esterase (DUF676)